MPQLRDGSHVEDARLDRIYEHDERNREFPATALLERVNAPRNPVTTMWPISITLDQGREGSCVGNGFAHEAAAEPIPVPNVNESYAHNVIYWGTQQIDPWPGGSYPGATPQYEGTSVLSGAKMMVNLGFYDSYHWARSEPEMALAVSYLGPVVIGVNWWSHMYNPNKLGFLKPTGSIVGGHCILVRGYNAESRFYTVHNSWGPDWGDNGDAKVSATDMAKLIKNQGEVCVPDGRKLVTLAA